MSLVHLQEKKLNEATCFVCFSFCYSRICRASFIDHAIQMRFVKFDAIRQNSHQWSIGYQTAQKPNNTIFFVLNKFPFNFGMWCLCVFFFDLMNSAISWKQKCSIFFSICSRYICIYRINFVCSPFKSLKREKTAGNNVCCSFAFVWMDKIVVSNINIIFAFFLWLSFSYF